MAGVRTGPRLRAVLVLVTGIRRRSRTDTAPVQSNMPSSDAPGWRHLRHALLDVDSRGGDRPATAAAPLMDVLETSTGLEIVVDVPGLTADHLQVIVQNGTLHVLGEKRPSTACRAGAMFLVAERTAGRFLRSVPLRFAFDAGEIKATIRQGELRISVPRREDRRGREITIPIETL